MKLQLAFDKLSLEEAIECIHKVRDYVDILEVGTPLSLFAGVDGIKKFRENFPEKEILSDMKIMDGGRKEASMAFDNGADYVTVLALTDHSTMKSCVEIAKAKGKKVVADMICVKDIPQTVKDLEDLGVDIIAVHTGTDQQKLGRTPLEDLKEIKKYCNKCQVAVAGGINENSVEKYVELNPDIIIVGNGITGADDPAKAAKIIKERMRG